MPWLTREEAAAHLKVSLRQFDTLRTRGEIPETRKAGPPRFETADLDAWMAAGKTVSPADPFEG
jgi:excisionase family DNA binding protein